MNISTQIKNDRFYTLTPYNKDFIGEAKTIGGKWDADEKCWHFDLRDEPKARNLLNQIFGTDGSSSDVVSVQVTVKRDIDERCGPIIIAGRVIATAWGRDSGAKPGDKIIFIERKPQSGGSMANWRTVLKKGTVFEIRDLAASALPMMDKISDIDYAVVTDKDIDPTAAAKAELTRLTEERDRIDQRIKELKEQISE